jgi:hypothetical protein
MLMAIFGRYSFSDMGVILPESGAQVPGDVPEVVQFRAEGFFC